MCAFRKLPGLMLALLSALWLTQSVYAVTLFSEGMLTPETISQVPAGFGSHGGAYFVPDFARNDPNPNLHNVWIVLMSGGAPTVFSTGNVDSLLAGMFLPSNWGTNAGKYLTVGRGRDASGVITQSGTVYTYTADGARALFGEYPNAPHEDDRVGGIADQE